MTEISNKALALLVLAALVVVVAATTIQLNQLNTIGLTGMPVQDGTVELEIASQVAIDVFNGTMAFGTCTPEPGVLLIIDSATNRTTLCEVPGGQQGSEFDYIGIRNIGNVNVTLHVSGNNPNTWVTGTNANFEVRFEDQDDSCSTGLQSSLTPIHTDPAPGRQACAQFRRNSGKLYMFGRVSIPDDADSGTDSGNTVTFTATEA